MISFETDLGAVKPGFHVTQLIARRESAVDCGGTRSQSDVSVVQLLDGMGGPGMNAGTFQNILKQSAATAPDLLKGSVIVVFGHLNTGKSVYEIASVEESPQSITIRLRPLTAFCSPMIATEKHEAVGCCGGTSARQSACCG